MLEKYTSLAGYEALFGSVNSPPITDGSQSTVDLVLNAIVSSNKIRYGGVPAGDNIGAMRNVLAKVIADGRPVPMLMPWGSKKPDNGALDVAEVGALLSLKALQERVQRVYEPGILLAMRVEDTSGDYLFKEEGEKALHGSENYVKDFIKLVRIMDLPFIDLKLESDLMDARDYVALANELRPHFYAYLSVSETYGIVDDPSLGEWRKLSELGWKGFIPEEMRGFYRSRYARMGLNYDEQTEKMAGYFASILARIKLGGYGSEQWGKNFINISFAPPVPGTPPAFAERRVYYRTVPENMARTHIPPWRAKGFLRLSEGKATIKLATFEDQTLGLMTGFCTPISRGGDTVMLRINALEVKADVVV